MESGEQCEHGGLKRQCRICELETELQLFQKLNKKLVRQREVSRESLKKLEAENAELLKDKERLDWILKECVIEQRIWHYSYQNFDLRYLGLSREAIDKAMEEGE